MGQAWSTRNAQAIPRQADLAQSPGSDLSPVLCITQQVRPKMTALEEDQLQAGLVTVLQTILYPDSDEPHSPGSISLEPLDIDFSPLSPTTPV